MVANAVSTTDSAVLTVECEARMGTMNITSARPPYHRVIDVARIDLEQHEFHLVCLRMSKEMTRHDCSGTACLHVCNNAGTLCTAV
jgi:hypothetical protein